MAIAKELISRFENRRYLGVILFWSKLGLNKIKDKDSKKLKLGELSFKSVVNTLDLYLFYK